MKQYHGHRILGSAPARYRGHWIAGSGGAPPPDPPRAPISFVSVQAGNWNDPATWDDGVETPLLGDTVDIQHAVTATANCGAGDGTAVVGYDGATASVRCRLGGTLTISAGITFQCDGGFWTDGVLTLAAGARFEFVGTSVASQEFWIRKGSSQAHMACNGTSGAHCFVGAVGTASVHMPIWIWATWASAGDNRIVATWTDFSRFGESGIDFGFLLFPVDTDPALFPYLFTDCTFDQCTGMRWPWDDSTHNAFTGRHEMTRCKWSNTITGANDGEVWMMGAPTFTAKWIACDFDTNCHVYAYHPDEVDITDCVFRDGFGRNGTTALTWGTGPLGLFERNFITIGGTFGPAMRFGDTITDCYFIWTDVTEHNPHAGEVWGGTGTLLFNGCIWQSQYDGSGLPAEGDGYFAWTTTGGTQATNILRLFECISTPNGLGYSADSSMSTTMATLGDVSGAPDFHIEVEHCTACVSVVGVLDLGHVGDPNVPADMVQQFQSNICFNGSSTPQSSGLKINASTGQDTNSVWADQCTHNAGFGLGTGTGIKHYDNFPQSPSRTIGDNDVDGVDPLFVAPNRNAVNWQPAGTLEATMDHLAANQSMASLLAYVREGFRPTAAAYDGAAHDGGTIGAVPF